jgi:hypothetical protein
MSPLRRGTPAEDAYLDLQNQARRTKRPTQELHQLYVLEGFLARLTASEVRDSLVLKGGVLLAAFDSRRPTKDVDLAALDMANDTETVLGLIRRVLAVELPTDDGIAFNAETLRADVIRDEEEYAGVRVHAEARLATAILPFHADINVGDPIWPAPTMVELPRLLGGEPVTLRGYPVHMVHAEKIVTALQRGISNTRWRDFGDIWTLSRHQPVDADDLLRAIEEVARYRGTTLGPLAGKLDGYAEASQTKWAAWRRRSNSDHLPEAFAPILEAVMSFADPVICGDVTGQIWHPEAALWQSAERA